MKRHYRLRVKQVPNGELRWAITRVFETGRQESSIWYDDSAAAVYSVLYYGL